MISAAWVVVIGLCLLIGLIGTIVPGLPGAGLVFLGILIYAWLTNFQIIGLGLLVFFGLGALLAMAAAMLGSMVAAKMGGAARGAFTGLFVGLFAGIFVPIWGVGIVAGALVGSFLGALLIDKVQPDKAWRIALFTLFGLISGTLAQFLIAIFMIGVFLVVILF